MLSDTEFAKRMDKYLNRPYKLGEPESGCDCLSIILDVYRDQYEFPKEFEGVTEKNYAEVWRKDPKKTKDIWARFLQTVGEPVEKNYFRRADILLFKSKDVPLFFAIALGNGNMKMVFEEGAHVVPFHLFQRYFIGARRLIDEEKKEKRR